MITAEPVSLNDQQMLVEHFLALDIGLSEYSFPNVYLFREQHQYKVITGQSIYVRGVHRDGCTYLMVTEPVHKLPVLEFFQQLCQTDYLYPVPNTWRPLFPPNIFLITNSEADTDYIYTLEKLREYPGRKLSGKRNLVKQFMESYAWRAEPLSIQNTADAKVVLTEWQRSFEESDPADVSACNEALTLWGQFLNLEGRIYYVDNKPAGFIIGGKLTKHSHVVHFVKAIKGYKGIYQFIYQDYSKNLQDCTHCINLEQDLGNPQLAQAKHSYEPDCLCVKLRIALQPEIKDQVCKGTLAANFKWQSNN